MTWLEDMSLRDLDDSVIIEATCMRCLMSGCKARSSFLLKGRSPRRTPRRSSQKPCLPETGCRHVGVRLTLIKNEDTSGFVGGMPAATILDFVLQRNQVCFEELSASSIGRRQTALVLL